MEISVKSLPQTLLTRPRVLFALEHISSMCLVQNRSLDMMTPRSVVWETLSMVDHSCGTEVLNCN